MAVCPARRFIDVIQAKVNKNKVEVEVKVEIKIEDKAEDSLPQPQP
jgi:hypothetical protein